MLLNILKARNDGEVHHAELHFEPDDKFLGVSLNKPVEVFADFQVLKKDVILKLRFEYIVQTECDLCCTDMEHKGNVNISELVKFGTNSENEDFYTYTGDEIRLDKLLNEAILFSLPSQFLCKENCKGLCHLCGLDKNFTLCGCDE